MNNPLCTSRIPIHHIYRENVIWRSSPDKEESITVCQGLSVLSVSSVGPEFTAGRCVSEITITSIHSVSWAVIHSCIHSPQTAHFQVQSALIIVFGDSELTLQSVSMVDYTTTTTNVCDPLQSLHWSLGDPVHSVATEGESRGCKRES